MSYELMMSQPCLLCPRHAACVVDHVCLIEATKQSNASRSGTGRADQSDSRGGLPAAAGPLSAARAAGEEQGSDGVPLAWPSDGVPAIISSVWRARVRLGLRCAAERYGDNVWPGPALQFAHPHLGHESKYTPIITRQRKEPCP